MRTYATIRGTFWNRGSGKKLKGDHLGRELALYLMTCSQGTACGIFFINLPTIAYDLGEPVEVIREALGRITEIAEYDEDADLCWVPNTAKEQIGETMKPGDRRRVKLVRELEQFAGHRFVAAFVDKYSDPYGLSKDHRELLVPPSDGASDAPQYPPSECAKNDPSQGPSDGVQQLAATPSTVSVQIRSDQVGGPGEAVTCPRDLELHPDQIANMQMAGIERWAIDVMTSEQRSKWLGDESMCMKVAEWRKYLASTITRRWSNPKERPKRETATTTHEGVKLGFGEA